MSSSRKSQKSKPRDSRSSSRWTPIKRLLRQSKTRSCNCSRIMRSSKSWMKTPSSSLWTSLRSPRVKSTRVWLMQSSCRRRLKRLVPSTPQFLSVVASCISSSQIWPTSTTCTRTLSNSSRCSSIRPSTPLPRTMTWRFV